MVPFPLCAEVRHEPEIRRVIDGCVEFVRARLSPDTLVAIVLTGSFARGEGSVLAVGDRLKVLGDIEFFVVLARPLDYRRLRAEMASWGPLAAATVGGDRVQADVEFGPVHVGYLERRARPSIFVYDLRHHGKVLWGPPDLLRAMPEIRADAIPREDALRLLLNRTIEQLDAYDRTARCDGDGALDVAYQSVKVVLDLAGSALAFSGRHRASYAERPAGLARLVSETPSLARRLPSDFERDLADAARVKLTPDEGDFADTRWRTLRARIVAGIPAMLGLLRWELGQLLGGDDELEILLDRYLRAEPLARRVRDWTKLALNTLPAPLPLDGPAVARLIRRSTPRALIYAAGTLAYRDLERPRPDPTIGRLLPVAVRPDDPEAHRRAVVALWRWCVRNA
jgi:hypothetical protein